MSSLHFLSGHSNNTRAGWLVSVHLKTSVLSFSLTVMPDTKKYGLVYDR